MSTVDRRSFLRKSSLLAGAAIIAPSLQGLIACADATAPYDANGVALSRGINGRVHDRGYGPLLVSGNHPEISIPDGFHARLLSWTGKPMSDGNITGNALDGMGAFLMGSAGPRDRVRLVRNHEHRNTANRRTLAQTNAYDDQAPGGNTTLELIVHPSGDAELLRDWVSLNGTYVNCAGGTTPWGSWISSEETVAGKGSIWAQNHGYNFEIQASADAPVTPVPLREMGRFVHEAVAVDQATGIVYETEDRNPGGFYRFVPRVAGQLALGGTLQILVVKGRPAYDTRVGQVIGSMLEVEWADIPQPDTDQPNISSGFVYNQVPEAARFSRLEGCWYGDGGIYFNATSGGDAGAGQVFKYMPTGPDAGALAMIYESPSTSVLNSPDNICISPRGGIVICEDGAGTNYVRGITRTGEVFDLVRNNINTSEWAGACFAPGGRTLFVNMQGSTDQNNTTTLGRTFAIWGPWERGAL
jgi:hypothetical protein